MRRLLMATCILLWNSFHVRIRAENDIDETEKTHLEVNPCQLIGNDSERYADVFVKTDSQNSFYIGLPKDLSPGKYRCEWRLILHDDAATNDNTTSGKTKSGFRTIFDSYYVDSYSRNIPTGFKKLEVTLTVPAAEYSWQKFAIERYMNGRTARTPNNTVIILEATIDGHLRQNLNFAQVTVIREEFDFPKRFRSTDIIRKTKSIKNHRFTWTQARRYCKRAGLDLCPRFHDGVCVRRTPFSHTEPNIATQYFPILPYNHWVTVTNISDGSCNDDIAGPPRWGRNGALCPEQGCKSKSYIYCCKDKKVRSKNYDPKSIYVTSGRGMNGEIYYRYAEEQHMTDDYSYYYTPIWKEFWKSAARISGDIAKFKISFSHSKRTPTAIYFCQKIASHLSLTDLEEYRFMMDLKPCQHPWQYKFFGYVSKKPRKGLSAVYIGQSEKGHGSRVSSTPWCCGYEKDGFVIYTSVKRNWMHKWKPELCGKFHLTEPTSNITVFASSDTPLKKAKPPMYCTWQIKATAGKALNIEYNLKRADEYKRNYEYLRFKNYESGRIYSQSDAGSFISDGNVIEINLAVEDSAPKFYIKYYTVNKPMPAKLVAYKVEGGNVTWSKARSLCRNKSLELCSRKAICPAGDYPYGGIRDAWIPVSDRFNEWIKASGYESYENTVCDFVSSTDGPPDWTERHSAIPDRSLVCCCDIPPVQWPEWEPVRVNVGYNSRHGLYTFNIKNEWDFPTYRYDYNDPYHMDFYYEVSPWLPPSTINGSNPNTIDYFVSSNRYVENVFDQVLYFCVERSYESAFDWVFMASLTQCKGSWEYKFHTYVGRTKSKEAPTLLTIGNIQSNDIPFCCQSNPASFEVYVVDTGKYESPSFSDYDYVNETSSSGDNAYLY